MTKDYREAFLSGDQEPWCFQGGLQAEFQVCISDEDAHYSCYRPDGQNTPRVTWKHILHWMFNYNMS